MNAALRDDIRQERPFRSTEQEAFLNIIRTASVLADDLEQILRPEGITLAQYNVLRILAGSEPDGLCRNDLRDRMLTRMPDMTRLLDRMERSGLVTRTRETEDRRLVTTRISDEGRALLDRTTAAVAAEHERRLGRLCREELATLIDLLSRTRGP